MRDFGPAYVRFGSGADIIRSVFHVRFTPESGHRATRLACLLSANSGQTHRSKKTAIRSPRRCGRAESGGTSRRSAFALFRLITSSYLGGPCTGKVGRLLTLENAVDVISCVDGLTDDFRSIRDQAAGGDEVSR